jgi:ABC-2 type transport system ATP-binding protein
MSQQDRQPIVEIEGLVKSYGPVDAVRGIDLIVGSGEIFGILGPNGAGKSTTMNVLAASLRPSAGVVRVAGLDVTRFPRQVKARIGIVFQEPSLDMQLTAWENLEFHAGLYQVPRSQRRRRIKEALQMVELDEDASRPLFTFSGGMRRRLEIVRSLLHSPRILFLDEPTLGLDPQVRSRVWEHLHQIRKQLGVAICMTTHYMDEAEFCDRIAIIDHGRIIAEGTPGKLKSQVGADIVTLHTRQPAAIISEIASRFDLHAKEDAGSLRLEVDDAAVFVPRLLRELSTRVDEITISRPSLDDVFLRLTGRGMRAEGAVPEAMFGMMPGGPGPGPGPRMRPGPGMKPGVGPGAGARR